MSSEKQTRLFREDGRIFAVTSQNCEELLDENKRSQNEAHKSDWGRPIAEIPNVIINKWLYEEWARGNRGLRYLSPEWKALVRRKLRDPDWRWLRLDNPSNPFHLGWRK